MKETIVFLVALAVIGFYFYHLMKRYSYNEFQKTMRAGDDCIFYQGRMKCNGTITKVMKTWVDISSIYGRDTLNKTDVLPNNKHLII